MFDISSLTTIPEEGTNIQTRDGFRGKVETYNMSELINNPHMSTLKTLSRQQLDQMKYVQIGDINRRKNSQYVSDFTTFKINKVDESDSIVKLVIENTMDDYVQNANEIAPNLNSGYKGGKYKLKMNLIYHKNSNNNHFTLQPTSELEMSFLHKDGRDPIRFPYLTFISQNNIDGNESLPLNTERRTNDDENEIVLNSSITPNFMTSSPITWNINSKDATNDVFTPWEFNYERQVSTIKRNKKIFTRDKKIDINDIKKIKFISFGLQENIGISDFGGSSPEPIPSSKHFSFFHLDFKLELIETETRYILQSVENDKTSYYTKDFVKLPTPWTLDFKIIFKKVPGEDKVIADRVNIVFDLSTQDNDVKKPTMVGFVKETRNTNTFVDEWNSYKYMISRNNRMLFTDEKSHLNANSIYHLHYDSDNITTINPHNKPISWGGEMINTMSEEQIMGIKSIDFGTTENLDYVGHVNALVNVRKQNNMIIVSNRDQIIRNETRLGAYTLEMELKYVQIGNSNLYKVDPSISKLKITKSESNQKTLNMFRFNIDFRVDVSLFKHLLGSKIYDDFKSTYTIRDAINEYYRPEHQNFDVDTWFEFSNVRNSKPNAFLFLSDYDSDRHFTQERDQIKPGFSLSDLLDFKFVQIGEGETNNRSDNTLRGDSTEFASIPIKKTFTQTEVIFELPENINYFTLIPRSGSNISLNSSSSGTRDRSEISYKLVFVINKFGRYDLDESRSHVRFTNNLWWQFVRFSWNEKNKTGMQPNDDRTHKRYLEEANQ